MSVNVLFVCLGNICRSPTAHGLFQAKVNAANLHHKITVDSAGTGGWHSGAAPDKRAQKIAQSRGYDISHLQARQVKPSDFNDFDYILAMDNENLINLQQQKPSDYKGVLGLFLVEAGVVSGTESSEVPDPYYGGEEHFEYVIDLIDQAVDGLLQRICDEHRLN